VLFCFAFYILSIYLSPEKVVLREINKIESGKQTQGKQEVTNEILNVLHYFKSNNVPVPFVSVHKIVGSNNVPVVSGVFTSEKYNSNGSVNSIYTVLVTFYLKKENFLWEITDVKVIEYKVQH